MAGKAGQIIACFPRRWLVRISIDRDKQSNTRKYQRLMAEAHQRKFDAILVWKIDRFGRSLKHLVTALADL